ncbi:uncharacterized protein METZ01_LOCUS424183, partial [marine metagenome]
VTANDNDLIIMAITNSMVFIFALYMKMVKHVNLPNQ